MSRLTTLFGGVAVLALLTVPSALPQSTTPFAVGFAEDLPKEIGTAATDPARALGATAFRLTTQWNPGQAQLDAGEAARLDRAVAAASGLRIFLSVYGSAGTAAPRDPASRDTYCGFVRALLIRYPAVRDVVIWNEPNKRLFWNPQVATDGTPLAPGEYEALLARCYDVLHADVSGVRVIGLALSSTGNDDAGSHTPGTFIRRVGDAYRTSGRTSPLLDAVAFHPYPLTPGERPWLRHIGSTTIGEGDWNKLMRNLWLAFAGTGQPLPGACSVLVCPVIWYLESGFQTRVDPAKAGSYTGTENVAGVLAADAGGEPPTPPAAGSLAPDQRTQILDAVRLAACQPYVAGILTFLLADEPRLEGWQSGALWADRTPKPSATTFSDVFADATAGSIDCASLKGGPPSSDYTPPPVPSVPTASVTENPLLIELRWDGVVDGSVPVAYRVYRDGVLIATAASPTWSDTGVARSSTYGYTLRALDAAGNLSDASASTTVSTPAAPPPASGGGGGGGTVATPADLSVTAQAGAQNLVPEQDTEIRVLVMDASGSQTATDVRVTIVLPDGVTLLGQPYVERGSGCTGSSTITCLLDFVPSGMETPVRFWVDVGNPGTKQIRVDVTAANEGTPADNTTTTTLSVAVPAAPPRAVRARGTTRGGTAGADRLVGTDRADVLRGGGGDDRLLGLGGDDVLVGGAGHDTSDGGPGDDLLRMRDRTHDTIRCGPGRDTVIADRRDTIAPDCELVRFTG